MSDSPDATPDPYLDSGAYALDALPASDVAAFEQAMQADPTLRAETESLQATAARLGMAGAEPAPADLRERVMAQVEGTRQDVPRAGSDSVVVPLRPRRSLRLLSAAAALLAVVALGLSGWVIGLRQENTSLSAAGAAVTRVLTAPDARTVSGSSRRPDGPGRRHLLAIGRVGRLRRRRARQPADRPHVPALADRLRWVGQVSGYLHIGLRRPRCRHSQRSARHRGRGRPHRRAIGWIHPADDAARARPPARLTLRRSTNPD